MKHSSKLLLGLSLGFLVFAIIACKPSEKIQPTETSENIQLSEEKFESQPPSVTEIVIDGEGDDWIDRPLLGEDPAGDTEGDFLDITNAYAFVNENSLYVLIEVSDPGSPFEQFDFEISGDYQKFVLTWQPTQEHIGQYQSSETVLGSVFEMRIDLRELESPSRGSVRISQIRVMAGEDPSSETWRPVDVLDPKSKTITWVNEVDIGQ